MLIFPIIWNWVWGTSQEPSAPQVAGDNPAPKITPVSQPAKWHLRIEYTTFEFDADDDGEICEMNPTCPTCGNPVGSGSGSGVGSGTGPKPPCTTCAQCTQPAPPWFNPLSIPPLTPAQRQSAWITYCLLHCNDPGFGCPDPTGGGGVTGDVIPHVQLEFTTFDVPEDFVAISSRCIDVPICGACP